MCDILRLVRLFGV